VAQATRFFVGSEDRAAVFARGQNAVTERVGRFPSAPQQLHR
jgi:hypothetical protein